MNVQTFASKAANADVQTIYGLEQPKYLVFREGGSAPTKTHTSRYNAAQEARRLARKQVGDTFHVVKIKESFRVGDAKSQPVSPGVQFEKTKQRVSAKDFAIGQSITVKDSHYLYGGATGVVTNIGSPDSDDCSIYALVYGDIQRFSPSSLTIAPDDTKADDSAPQVSAPMSIRDIMDRIHTNRQSLRYPDDGGLKEPVREFGDTFDGFAMLLKQFFNDAPTQPEPSTIPDHPLAATFPIGTPVCVVMESQYPGINMALDATIADYNPDEPEIVLIMAELTAGNYSTLRCNVDRIIAADDPKIIFGVDQFLEPAFA